jgi:hypothetical protein
MFTLTGYWRRVMKYVSTIKSMITAIAGTAVPANARTSIIRAAKRR